VSSYDVHRQCGGEVWLGVCQRCDRKPAPESIAHYTPSLAAVIWALDRMQWDDVTAKQQARLERILRELQEFADELAATPPPGEE